MKNKFTALLLLVLVYTNSFGQSTTDLQHKAPTLQIGLDALTFNKGVLDYELIMLIIAEKQQELKIKVIQNMFLDRLENTGGTVYSYADNVIRGITTEKDPDIRARRVLESTVNIVFVAALTEYYLRKCHADPALKANFDKLAANYTKTPIELTAEFRLKDLAIKQNGSQSVESSNDNARNFISMLIDLSSEVVRSDSQLKDLGLMQVSYSSVYDYKNLYLSSKRENESVYSDAENVFQNMKNLSAELTRTIGVVKYLKEEYSFRNEQINTAKLAEKAVRTLPSNFNALKAPLENVESLIDKIIKKLSDQNPQYNPQMRENISNLVVIRNYLKKANTMIDDINSERQSINIAVLSDIVYTTRFEFFPLIEQMTFMDAEMLTVLDQLKIFTAELATRLISANSQLSKLQGKIDPFVNFVAGLYEFNRAETISDYLKFINDVGEIFPDPKIKFALNTVNSFITDYTVVRVGNNEKEVIEFNVESFLAKLQTIQRDKYSPIQFHFTVGASTGYFDNKLITGTDTLQSFAYIGEKIGLKFKLWDSQFSRSRSPGDTYKFLGFDWIKTSPPREPLISNVHFLFYGSGLLYSILNTTNFKNFNAPIIGSGVGITFSNALDLNFTASFPVLNDRALKSSYKNSLYSVGFDIQFSEYFKRLGEKRRSKQLQNAISEIGDSK